MQYDLVAEDMSTPTHFTVDSVAQMVGFSVYRKKTLTRAMRIPEPFTCVTVDGNTVTCKDGYLALDSKNYPYPIDKEIFEDGYQEAG